MSKIDRHPIGELNTQVHWMRDDFDNLPASVNFTANSALLEVRSECAVTTTDTAPFDFLVRDYATTFPFAKETASFMVSISWGVMLIQTTSFCETAR